MILAQYPEAYAGQIERVFDFRVSIERLRVLNAKGKFEQSLNKVFWGVPPVQGTLRAQIVVGEAEPEALPPEAEYRRLVDALKLDDAVLLFKNALYEDLFFHEAAYGRCIELLGLLFDELLPRPGFEDERYVSGACNLLGNCYQMLGQPAKALRLYQRALELTVRAPGYSPNLVTELNCCASCEIEMGELQLAARRLQYCISIAKGIDWPHYTARRELGLVGALLGKADEADQCLQTAIQEMEQIGPDSRQQRSSAWCWRALNLAFQKLWPEALKAAAVARRLARVRKLPLDLSRAEWIHGLVLVKMGRLGPGAKSVGTSAKA